MEVKEGDLYKFLHFDVNDDGIEEIIALSAYNVKDGGYMGQLLVSNPKGEVIFAGPRPEKAKDPCAFGHFIYGNADLQAVVIDEDDEGRHVSLIGAMPISDLRPTPFRVWRWTQGMFVPEFINTLVEWPADSNCYVWQDNNFEYATDRWISKFWYNDQGELMGRIVDTTSSDRVLIGEAKLVVTENGFGINEWKQLPN